MFFQLMEKRPLVDYKYKYRNARGTKKTILFIDVCTTERKEVKIQGKNFYTI